VSVDQSPIGRTPRSNPATYTALFTPIRELSRRPDGARARYGAALLLQRERRALRGLPGRRRHQVEMHFLPDIYVACDTCTASATTRDAGVQFKGRNIHRVLQMTVAAPTSSSYGAAGERKLQTLSKWAWAIISSGSRRPRSPGAKRSG